MSSNNQYLIEAPTVDLKVTVNFSDLIPRYTISYKEVDLIEPSTLGIELVNADFSNEFDVIETSRNSVDEIWEPVWGSDATVQNRYEELHFYLCETNRSNYLLELTFRVFDDGVGFRYTLPEQEGLTDFEIKVERSEFRFSDDFTAWWIPACEMGPRPCSWIDSYEKIYSETPLSEIPQANTPVTIKSANDIYLTLHEAALVDYADMELAPIANENHAFESELVALPDGTKVKGTVPHQSPWRTLIVGDDPGDLIESHLLENLNEPCEFDDTSWIQPGKYAGIWWEMHKGVSEWAYGPNVGATTENMKRYIDFASEHGIPYVLAEGWNVGWGPNSNKPDFTRSHDKFDLDKVLDYCEEKKVQFIGHTETFGDIESFEDQLEETFTYYEKQNIPAIKTGYAGNISGGHHRHDQRMVNHYRRVIEAAATHQLMVDAHEPIKPTGEIRTYPNFVTREGVRGMEINASDSLGNGNPPEHTVTLPFTRMVAGPVDYTPGIFNIRWNPLGNDTRVHSTRARQLALYVIFLSGLQMAADLPEHYENHPELNFIEQVPVNWDESYVVNAAIGDYITLARRKGEEWYIGSGTDEYARTLAVPLDFLGGDRYVAEIYSDAPNTDLETNPEAVAIDECVVTADDTVLAPMEAGGGQAIYLRPSTGKEATSLPEYDPDLLPQRGEHINKI